MYNAERCYRIMDECGTTALVATTPQNLAYLSGCQMGLLEPPSYSPGPFIVIKNDPDKTRYLIASKVDLALMSQTSIWEDEVVLYGDFFIAINEPLLKGLPEGVTKLAEQMKTARLYDNSQEALLDVLKGLNLEGEKIGFDELGVDSSLITYLENNLKITEIIPASSIFNRMRMVKSKYEQKCIEKSTKIAFQAFKKVIASVKPGINKSELECIYRKAVIEQGAIPTNVTIACGPYSHIPVSGKYEYVIQSGDIVRFDLGCLYEVFTSDFARTAVVGKPTKNQLEMYDAVRKGVDAIIQKIKPGVKISELYNTGVRTVGEKISDFKRHHCGHAIGIGHEKPIITRDCDLELEKDMVFCVETPYYEIGRGGFALEETLCVKDGYPTIYTEDPRDLIIIP